MVYNTGTSPSLFAKINDCLARLDDSPASALALTSYQSLLRICEAQTPAARADVVALLLQPDATIAARIRAISTSASVLVLQGQPQN